MTDHASSTGTDDERASMPRPAPARGYLVYEADCRLCSATARWLEANARDETEIVPFGDDRVPPELDADRTQIHYIEANRVLHGGAAITRALRATPFAPLARLLDTSFVAGTRDLAYRTFARLHRRRRRA